MIEINNNQEKNITFQTEISGINPKELNGYLRIIIDGIEYGFKTTINEKTILVTIPNLKNIISRPIRESEKFLSKLDVYGNGYYLTPWEGEIKIKNSVMIEAKIIENKPTVSVKQNDSNKDKIKPIKPPIIKEKKKVVVTKDHLYRFMEKKGTKDKKIQEIVLETCINKVGDSDLKLLFKEIYNYYNK